MARKAAPLYRCKLGALEYSEIYGCSASAARKWAEQCAPLDYPDIMFNWIRNRRTKSSDFEGKTVKIVEEDYEATLRGGLAELYDVRHRRKVSEVEEWISFIDSARATTNQKARQFGFVNHSKITAATDKIGALVEELYDLVDPPKPKKSRENG